ncbi:MAG: TlpA family protein disulfide reductase [Gammaproteobacteria bacterium]|nr:MAG: TlpA family protein disulfide reductase [Gammaproteobacteria bacterium]
MSRACTTLVLLLLAGCERFDFGYADGTSGRFADWSGRWVVINYWAEWCAPCRYEIPELNELAVDSSADVLVVGVNYDGITGEDLTRLIARMGIEFTVMLVDPQSHFAYDRPSVLPTTVLIDPDGRVQEMLVGPQTRDSLEGRMSVPAAM